MCILLHIPQNGTFDIPCPFFFLFLDLTFFKALGQLLNLNLTKHERLLKLNKKDY